jgi:hypothetical protein
MIKEIKIPGDILQLTGSVVRQYTDFKDVFRAVLENAGQRLSQDQKIIEFSYNFESVESTVSVETPE